VLSVQSFTIRFLPDMETIIAVILTLSAFAGFFVLGLWFAGVALANCDEETYEKLIGNIQMIRLKKVLNDQ
jgi:hypothetical protein